MYLLCDYDKADFVLCSREVVCLSAFDPLGIQKDTRLSEAVLALGGLKLTHCPFRNSGTEEYPFPSAASKQADAVSS